jgi:hypothetical protein
VRFNLPSQAELLEIGQELCKAGDWSVIRPIDVSVPVGSRRKQGPIPFAIPSRVADRVPVG